MNDILLTEYHQPTSRKIIENILPFHKYLDPDALKIILFATENGLRDRTSAEAIASAIKKMSIFGNFNLTFVAIIEYLSSNSYFFPTDEISELIENFCSRTNLEDEDSVLEQFLSDNDCDDNSEPFHIEE